MISLHEADTNVTHPNLFNEKMASLTLAEPEDEATFEIKRQAEDMQRRCQFLLHELEQFNAYIKDQKREKTVHFGAFNSGVKSEVRFLDKIARADPKDPKVSLGIMGSNFLYYSSLWSYAKICKSVTALMKTSLWIPGQNTPYINGNAAFREGSTKGKKVHNVMVDIVLANGLEWVKVCTTTEKRIIWDLAKAGWTGSSDDDSDYEDDDDARGVLKLAEMLTKASKAARINYRNPTVRMVFTRIKAIPESKEVANVLQRIRNLGIVVQTADEISPCSLNISDVLPIMAAEPLQPLTETLNVDCTILLALVSDVSHFQIASALWRNNEVVRQIKDEVKESLLPTWLWPTFGSRNLLCTREAATQMQKIVSTIGTETEKQRTSLLFNRPLPRELLLREVQNLSDQLVPRDWALPIKIMDDNVEVIKPKLPNVVAGKVFDILSPINRSVFGYGWANGLTTITSNGAVARQIMWIIEENRVGEEIGPDIWLAPVARSLLGVPKELRKWEASAESELSI